MMRATAYLINVMWRALYNGGKGSLLACTTATARIAIPGAGSVSLISIYNKGANEAYVALGDSTVEADVLSYPIPIGQQVFLPTQPLSGSVTHIAGITAASTTSLVITSGTANFTS